jgi:hypothetical protein
MVAINKRGTYAGLSSSIAYSYQVEPSTTATTLLKTDSIGPTRRKSLNIRPGVTRPVAKKNCNECLFQPAGANCLATGFGLHIPLWLFDNAPSVPG